MSQRESAIRLKVNHPRPVEEEEEMRSKYLAINAFRLGPCNREGVRAFGPLATSMRHESKRS
jgi:hypothetical protein